MHSFRFLAVLPVAFALLVSSCGPDLRRYQALVSPRIAQIPDEAMLVIDGKGDPDGWMGPSLKELYKAWFKVKRQQGLSHAAPKARFPADLILSNKSSWTGEVGLPIPVTVGDEILPTGTRMKRTTWKYGPTAEILHLGPYRDEPATIARLKAFITNQGYRISGPHEEEYLVGPGMFGKGNPAKYQTLIRYPVEKASRP